MAKNSNMHKAKKEKNDEFYTRLDDIANELKHYKDYFKDKIVFCNCDDPEESMFWKYFELNFEFLDLKKLVSTHYDDSEPTYKLELEKVNGELIKTVTDLKQNGDFRSPECIDILKECDIVVTNPPFSLFREYVAQLMGYEKKFLIIGNQNAIAYKEIFPLIKEKKMWIGVSPRSMTFIRPDGSEEQVNACWFTNLDHKKRHEKFIPYMKYKGNEHLYKKYINFDAINVDKANDIPDDFDGLIGVPITFLDKFNPEQFEIVGSTRHSPELTLDLSDKQFKFKDKNGNLKNKKLGQSPYILVDSTDKSQYYLCDDYKGYIIELYQRLLIKWKK